MPKLDWDFQSNEPIEVKKISDYAYELGLENPAAFVIALATASIFSGVLVRLLVRKRDSVLVAFIKGIVLGNIARLIIAGLYFIASEMRRDVSASHYDPYGY